MKLVAFERVGNSAPVAINPEFVVRIEKGPSAEGKPPTTKIYLPFASGEDRMPSFVQVFGDFMEVAGKLEGA